MEKRGGGAWLWFWACAWLASVAGVGAYRLNVPQVLLPVRVGSAVVNFSLEISDPSGGCFHFSSARPQVAAVSMGEADCSDTAVVSALATSKDRTIITATEKDGAAILRCDVLVDRIASLEVLTTTRQLFLEDAPQEFSVLARNDKADVFTDLGPTPFRWSVSGGGEGSGKDVLRLVPFLASVYEAPPEIAALEEAGRQGHKVLMEGRKTGTARLTLSLPNSDLPPASLDLLVVANFLLQPADVLIPPLATVHYTLLLLKQSKTERMPLPSDDYSLALEGPSEVAALDVGTSTLSGLSEGVVEVRLVEESMEGGRGPGPAVTARVEVATPASLHFTISPGKDWVLESGRRYQIGTRLEDSGGRHLSITDNARLEIHLPEAHLAPQSRTENGSFVVVEAKKVGRTRILGSYVGAVDEAGELQKIETAVEGSREVEIVPPLSIHPPVLVLLWEEGLPLPSASLQGEGGSGSYAWSIESAGVARIAEGSGLVQAESHGEADITLRDARNSLHSARGLVAVVPPVELVFLPGPREAEVGVSQPLRLSLTLKARLSDGQEVDIPDCSHVRLRQSLSPTGIFRILPSSAGTKKKKEGEKEEESRQGCVLIQLGAVAKGEAVLSVDYKGLKAETRIAAFEPLRLSSPEAPEPPILIAPGSEWRISAMGGPIAWSTAPSAHFARLQASPDSELSVWPLPASIQSNQPHSFRIRCETTEPRRVRLSLSVGNEATPANPRPKRRQLELEICCAPPRRFHLALAEAGKCPLPASAPRPVPADERRLPLVLEAEGHCPDESIGRGFANFSSLHLQWSSSPGGILKGPRDGLPPLRAQQTSSQSLDYEPTAGTKNQTGTIRLSVSSDSYQFHAKAEKKGLGASPSGNLEMAVVERPRLQPDTLPLFNHPQNGHSIEIHGGSGHFRLLPSADKATVAQMSLKGTKVEVSPKGKGETEALVEDLCLPARPRLVATISVSGIRRLEVRGAELVEVGKEVEVEVGVVDDAGRRLRANLLPLLSIRGSSDVEGILGSKEAKTSRSDALLFLLKGLKPGIVHWSVQGTAADGSLVSAPPHRVEVYPPLRILPPKLLLTPGSVFQLSSEGGPQSPPLPLHWSSNDSALVSLSSTGLLEADKIGFVSVTARLHSGKEVFSEAKASVEVVALSGVEIEMGTSSGLESGEEMPVVAVGLASGGRRLQPHSLPVQGLHFAWTLEDGGDPGNLLRPLLPLLPEHGQPQFAQRFRAGPLGLKAEIRLEVSDLGGRVLKRGGGKATATAEVKVLPSLAVLRPQLPPSAPILLTPETSLQLQLNRDKDQVSYSSQAPNLFGVEGKGLLHSFSTLGLGALRVSDGEMDRLVEVEVARVAYAMISSDLSLGQPLPHLPVGFNWPLSVSLHDARGRRFAATDRSLRFRLHRTEMATLALNDSASLRVHLKSAGVSVLSVWDADEPQRLWDVVALPAGPLIQAPSQVTVASLICPSMTLAQPRWSHQGPLQFLREGVFLSLHQGMASISATLLLDQSTSVDVEIQTPLALELGPANVSFLSDLAGSPDAIVPIRLGSTNVTTSDAGETCPPELLKELGELESVSEKLFSCGLEWAEAVGEAAEVPPTHLFHARPAFIGGSFVCLLKGLPFPASAHSLPRLPARLRLYAQLLNSGVRGSALIDFHPSFRLQDSEIVLDDRDNLETRVGIAASERVAASLVVEEVPGWGLLSLSETKRAGDGWEVVVSLRLSSKSLWAAGGGEARPQLRFRSSLTGQTELVEVDIRLFGERPSLLNLYRSGGGIWSVGSHIWEEYSSLFLVFISVAATLFALYLGWRFVLVFTDSSGGNQSAALRSNGHLAAFQQQQQQHQPRHVHETYSPFLSQQPLWSRKNASPNDSISSQASSPSRSLSSSPFLWSRDRARDPPSSVPPNLWSSPR